MTKEKIEILDLQPTQCSVTRFENVLSAQPVLIRFLWFFRRTKEYLARDQPGVSRPPYLPENSAHCQFRTAPCIALGIVEKVYPVVVTFSHQTLRDFIGDLIAKREP